jgi:hypothetical protein
MTRKAVVNWVAQIQYVGKQPIWFGTLVVDANLRSEEVLAAMTKEIETHIPSGFRVVNLRRGQAWLVFDEDR